MHHCHHGGLWKRCPWGGGRLLVELFRDQRPHSTDVERIELFVDNRLVSNETCMALKIIPKNIRLNYTPFAYLQGYVSHLLNNMEFEIHVQLRTVPMIVTTSLRNPTRKNKSWPELSNPPCTNTMCAYPRGSTERWPAPIHVPPCGRRHAYDINQQHQVRCHQ